MTLKSSFVFIVIVAVMLCFATSHKKQPYLNVGSKKILQDGSASATDTTGTTDTTNTTDTNSSNSTSSEFSDNNPDIRRIDPLSNEDSISCQEVIDGNYYDLTKLRSPVNYKYNISESEKIIFNFCAPTKVQCKSSFTNYYALAKDNDTHTCTGFSGYDVKYQSLNPFDATDGIIINYGEAFEIQMACLLSSGIEKIVVDQDLPESSNSTTSNDLSGTNSTTENTVETSNSTDSYALNDFQHYKKKFNITGFTYTNNKYILQVESIYACPKFSAGYLWQFISQYKWIFISIGGLLGLVELFLGQKLFRFTLFLVGFLGGFIPSGIFLFNTFGNGVTWENWVMFVVVILIGLFCGYIVTTMQKFGFMVAGGVLGFFIAIFFNSLFIYKIPANPENLPGYMAMIYFSIFGAIAAIYTRKYVLMVTTSFVGSYVVIRAISGIFGGYPNEFQLAEMIKYNEIASVPWTFYLYMMGIIILAAIGMAVQVYLYKREKVKRILEEESTYRKAE